MNNDEIMDYLNNFKIENVEIEKLPKLDGMSRTDLDDLYNRLTQKKMDYEYNHREDLKELTGIEKECEQLLLKIEKDILEEEKKLDLLLEQEYGFKPQKPDE